MCLPEAFMPTRTLGLCVYQPIEQATIAMTQRTRHLPQREHLGSVGAPGTVLVLVITSGSGHFHHAHPTEEDTDLGANNHGNSLNLGCGWTLQSQTNHNEFFQGSNN